MNLHGRGKLRYFGGMMGLLPGDTVLIPAALERYSLEGSMKMLLARMKAAPSGAH